MTPEKPARDECREAFEEFMACTYGDERGHLVDGQDYDYEDMLACFRAAYSRSGSAGQWRPIESAPKDEVILLFGAKKSPMVAGMLHSRDGWVIDTPSEWMTMYPPTHWMPLPEPPPPGAREGGEVIDNTKCEHCGNVQQTIKPWKSIPRCRKCRKLMRKS